MRAYVLSIGSELVLGQLTDTNATFLAQELAGLGVELTYVTQVGDDRSRVVAVLRAAAVEAGIVICTGGIGPTDDDLTREAIAEVVGQQPEVDPALLANIRAFFAGRGLDMPDQNAKQAWLIPAAEPLPNPVGTAPGWFVRDGDTIIVAMPGVPREMYRMWREEVVPRLQSHLPQRIIRSANIKTLGIGESAVAQLLDDLIKLNDPVVATYAKDDGVHVRITVSAGTEDEANGHLAPALAEVRRRLRDYAYAEDDVSLPTSLIAQLRKRNATLAVMEVGTGGRFGSLLLSDPSASGCVPGTIALPLDATSAPTALDCARQVRDRFDASIGLGTVAMATATDQGLYDATITIAVAGGLQLEQSFPLRATFAEVQRRAALHAADVLRRALGDTPPADDS